MLRDGVDRGRLAGKLEQLREARPRQIGYPVNMEFDYHELAPFLEYSLNNVGDPYQESHVSLNTLDLEREVIDTFAWMAEVEPGESWGYVTSGGTEGNMYGLYLARELHPEGVVYFSEEIHYSVAKILRLQHTSNIMLKAQPNGELDYEDLRESIKINRHRPPIIFANIGTTMKGAVDDLDKIRAVLRWPGKAMWTGLRERWSMWG